MKARHDATHRETRPLAKTTQFYPTFIRGLMSKQVTLFWSRTLVHTM